MRGKDFVREMDALAQPVAKMAAESAGELLSNLNDDEAFRLLAQFWYIEGPTIGHYSRSWWNSIPSDPTGKYGDVELLLARQLYDESRHGKLYADACVRKGYIQDSRELYGHPYSKPVPAWLNFTTWLIHLGNHHFTTLYAGEQLASEGLIFPQVLKATVKALQDPVVKWVFEAQEDEEAFHGMCGKYVVTKYCQTPELQAEAAWAVETTLRLEAEAFADLGKFVKDGITVPRPAPPDYSNGATRTRRMPRVLDQSR